jgi:sporulation protein YlmC with PRC-barrel domain
MLSEGQVQHVIGRDAYSQDGEKIGKVGQVFLDDDTNRRSSPP